MTMPRRVSDILDKKAKRESVPLSKAILAMIEDALDEISDEEDKYLSDIADERIAASDGTFIPMSEIWTPEHGLRHPL